MDSDTITSGDTISVHSSEQQSLTDELLVRVRDKIVGGVGTGQIVDSLFLKTAIDLTSQSISGSEALEALERRINSKIDHRFAEASTRAAHNIVINGAMRISQRGKRSTSHGYLVDRFKSYATSMDSLRIEQTQNVVTDLPGFTRSLKVRVET